MADDEVLGICACCCLILVVVLVFGGGGSSDHQDSSTNINVNSNSFSSDSSSTKNPSTNSYSSKSSNTGYQEIVIEAMVLEDRSSLSNRIGFGYIGTLIPKDKNYIIKLYEYDWDEIMRRTNGNPVGKTIYVDIQHDDFEEKWDGDDFYYIEEFY